MATLEQKKKNQKYILDNLDKYVLDSRGSFYSYDMELEPNNDYFFISDEVVEDYEEVKKKFINNCLKDRSRWSQCFEMEFTYELTKVILSEKEDWELLILDAFPEGKIKHKSSGIEIDLNLWNWSQKYFLIGEFGYRGFHNGIECSVGVSIWGKYDEKRDWELEWIESEISRQKSKHKKTHHQPTPPENQQKDQPNQNPTPPSENNPPQPLTPPNQTPPSPKETDNPNKLEQNNSSPKKEENKPTNPLPSPADIQNHYYSDKAKTEITNNPKLTDTKEKQKAEELLKLIITAELLVKETKFNSEILTKLLKEKEQNCSTYQLLNKDKRIDQVINQLQNIEKKDNSATNNQNQPNNNPSLFKIIIPISLSLLAIVGITVLVKRKKKRNN